MSKKTYIISLGGSIIVPSAGVNVKFLRAFHDFIKKRLRQGDSFWLVCGGGATARSYIKAAQKITKVKNHDGDWLGIQATRLNAYLLKSVLSDVAYSEVVVDPNQNIKTNKRVIIASGYQPGNSTDYVAALLAKKYRIDKIINLSNIEYVYDKDPNKYADAKRLEIVDWPAFKKLVGNRWHPGLNAPFDPIAARICASSKIEVAIMNGQNLKNLEKYLLGKKFIGTVIK